MKLTSVTQSTLYRHPSVTRRRRFETTLGLLVIILWSMFVIDVFFAAVPIVPGSSPELHLILPRGVERGCQSTLTFTGVRLNNALEILFYDQGITAKSFRVINHKTIEVVVSVTGDCRLGEHVAQVRNDRGISDFRSVFVGPFPGVAEVEPNNRFEEAQSVELNQTVNGCLPAEDVDRFRLNLQKDQRLSVEIEAMRLGTFVDPVIELLGPHHADSSDAASLAFSDDNVLTNQDGFFSVIIPEAGTYTVVVTESAFEGTPKSHYRLHIGDFPRPQCVFPAGGKSGTRMSLKQVCPEASVIFDVDVPSADAFRGGVMVADADGVSPSPVKFRVTDLDDFDLPEDAKNVDFSTAVRVEVPSAINGRLNTKFQYFKISAKKDQTWDIHALAKQIGSGLDPLLNIFNEKKKHLMGKDDSPSRPDSTVRFKVPEDGDYYIRIKDYQNRVEPRFPYRIEISPAKPSVVLAIKRNDRFSQKRQSIAIAQGGRFAAIMSVTKDFVSTGVVLNHGPLPDGVNMAAVPMTKSVSEMPVVFDADVDAPLGGALVDFAASIHHPNGQEDQTKKSETKKSETTDLDSRFEMPAVWSLGLPNNTPYHRCSVDRLAVGVTKRLPFSIDCVPLEAPLVRNGSAKVKVVIRRDEGFKEVIRLQFPYRPPGIGTNHQLQVGPDKTEFEYPINANNGAALGKWPFYVIANANVEGPAWTSSQLCELEIAEPFVQSEATRLVGGRGQTLPVKIALEQLVEFEGVAQGRLRSLPPHTTVDGPLKFDNTTESLTFQITTTDKTPYGQHKGLFLEVEIPSGGGFSTARAGKLVLQVNRPSKKADSKLAPKETQAEAKKAPAAAAEKSPSESEEK